MGGSISSSVILSCHASGCGPALGGFVRFFGSGLGMIMAGLFLIGLLATAAGAKHYVPECGPGGENDVGLYQMDPSPWRTRARGHPNSGERKARGRQ